MAYHDFYTQGLMVNALGYSLGPGDLANFSNEQMIGVADRV